MSDSVVADMCGVKSLLARCGNDIEVRNIAELVDTFLLKYCRHSIVEDYIDITPDRGQYVSYCRICLCTISKNG
jgi:hypothetical protein